MPHQLYSNVVLSLPEEMYDIAYAVLNDYPLQGIEEGHDSIVVCFKQEDWTSEVETDIMSKLQTFIPDCSLVSTEIIEQKNWNEEWEQSLEPVVIDDMIIITPSWHAHSVSHPLPIIIDPKMSFGTGYHPTTRMTTRLIREYAKPQSYWIDAGTGTGVLAIAAAKLGVRSVFAFDYDEWSVENARENIERNRVAENVAILQADIFTVELPQVDGIAANMYRNVLIPSFPKLHAALRSHDSPLIISGILQYDEEELRSEAEKVGFTHVRTDREDEWLAMVFTRG